MLFVSLCLAALGSLSAGAAPVAASTTTTTAHAGAALLCSAGDATVFGLGADRRTITVRSLTRPIDAGPSTPPVQVARLPFAARTIVAITGATVLVTDARGSLYEIDLTSGSDDSITVVRRQIATGMNYDAMAYDGEGHLFALAGGTLFRHDLGASPLAGGAPVSGASNAGGAALAGGFTIGPRAAVGSGYAFQTLTAIAGNWVLGTTKSGEWDSVQVTANASGRLSGSRHVLGTWPASYRDVVSTGGGTYYGRTAAGGLDWFYDPSRTDGSGTDVFGPETIDASGWDQQTLSAVPVQCGVEVTLTSTQLLPGQAPQTTSPVRTTGRTRSVNGFGAGWCTEGAAIQFHAATGLWMDIHGDAWAWADAARRAGWTVVTSPAPRAVVVFQPNVLIARDRAGALGHVAWVDAVQTRADGTWLHIVEMNAFAGRGGWDSRWIKHNPGISAATNEPAMQYILAP